jgi:hypothetical protein
MSENRVVYDIPATRAAEITARLLAYIGFSKLVLCDQHVLDFAKNQFGGKELAFAFYTIGKLSAEHEYSNHARHSHHESDGSSSIGEAIHRAMERVFSGMRLSYIQKSMNLQKEHLCATQEELEQIILNKLFSSVLEGDVKLDGLADLGIDLSK